jgi:alpha-beta hydrolase superfamily lysophospholipase
MSHELAIIFVPGSFSPAAIYAPLAEAVKTQGLDITVVELATVGKKPGPNPTMYDDTAVIAAEVKKHVDQGKDVILIAHSYGGIPATEATKGLSKAEREGEGKKGGVIRLAYLTALVPAVGMAAGQSLKGALRGYVELGEVSLLALPSRATYADFMLSSLR